MELDGDKGPVQYNYQVHVLSSALILWVQKQHWDLWDKTPLRN